MKARLPLFLALLFLAGCSEPAEDTTVAEDMTATTPAAESEEHAYTNVTDASFDEFLAKSDVAVLEFWATWCGPCKIMGPRFESVAGKMQQQASFAKVDVDDNPKIAFKYGIRSIPTVVIVKNDQVVETLVGVQPEDALQSAVAQHLN